MSELPEFRHQKRNTAALVHLVFNRGMEIDDAMDLIAGIHPSTVEGYARRGRAEFRAFEGWIKRELEVIRLAHELGVWQKMSLDKQGLTVVSKEDAALIGPAKMWAEELEKGWRGELSNDPR